MQERNTTVFTCYLAVVLRERGESKIKLPRSGM